MPLFLKYCYAFFESWRGRIPIHIHGKIRDADLVKSRLNSWHYQMCNATVEGFATAAPTADMIGFCNFIVEMKSPGMLTWAASQVNKSSSW